MPLHRFAPFNTSVRSQPNPSHTASISTPDLRPYPPAGLGESNARRLLKRSQLSKKATREAEDDEEEAIIPSPQETTLEAIVAAAAAAASISAALPFDSQPIGYSVQCYATHAEDAARDREAAATEREKLVLFHSINSSRHAEGSAPLRLKPSLSQFAQEHANALSTHTASSTIPHYLLTGTGSTSRTTAHPNSVVVVMAPSGARVARLVSPPRIGALACGELWYGGKYRRHLYDMSGKKASAQHPDDCPCHLRMVFETMVDEGWRAMGIGRGGDGRWVVELGQ